MLVVVLRVTSARHASGAASRSVLSVSRFPSSPTNPARNCMIGFMAVMPQDPAVPVLVLMLALWATGEVYDPMRGARPAAAEA